MTTTVHPLSKTNEKVKPLDELPTLDDVLYRQSQPPVCLYNYYIILRDRLKLESLLDFWLDVAQADILYKRYIKYMNKPNKTRPSVVIDSPPLMSPRSDILTQMLLSHPRISLATTASKRPPPTQQEMIETVERIYLRYIVPSAEKEILQLPYEIKTTINQLFSNTQDNPMIFTEAKDYVHQILASTFHLFLRYKAYMNLTWPQQIGRLALGLFLLLFGFSLEFSLIFLDIHPWQKRLWGLLPISLGVYSTVTSITGVDPIWVLIFNLSETVPFRFNHIIQLKVKQILKKKAIMISCIILFIILILMVFFCSLAGRRL